jgi:hypothetical protein
MGPKLLFVLGIVVAHGAVAASLVRQEAPKQREGIATCVRAPQALPHIHPKRELLAMADIPTVDLQVRQQ